MFRALILSAVILPQSQSLSIKMASTVPTWDALSLAIKGTPFGEKMVEQESLRLLGEGLPHTDAALRLFGTKDEPRVIFYRDTAAWCPYCQKVWILLEEKRIPYKVEKINMRSYGDKPAEFLRKVPNGLLPAISLDGILQTDSLPIMLNLERTFTGPAHPQMWPKSRSKEEERAQRLMQLERDLFSRWCNLVFRPSLSGGARKTFEEGLALVDAELGVSPGPWFLTDLSIVDLTYISHIERMCASVAYWSGFIIRGNGRFPNIERWMAAFEGLPSYMASKSDYYTHVMDIPPQYGPGYSPPGMRKAISSKIDGTDGSWCLPLTPLGDEVIEPYSSSIDPGDEDARREAAYKLIKNSSAVTKFALRGAGKPGVKQFQAPLADPYATPALEHLETMDQVLRCVADCIIKGSAKVELGTSGIEIDSKAKASILKSLEYLRLRVGVPRDMSYPAARQLRAYLISAEQNLI